MILLATAGLWVGLLWIGWSLVFMGASEAVVSASSGAPAGFWERAYFGGYTVATLGLGDFVPDGPAWRLLTVMSAASGLVFITLAVTYYTAVLQAVVQEQQFALLVNALGDSPAAIVVGAWNGGGFPGLDTVLPSLASLLALHARRHYAYPVIHYFRPADAQYSAPVQTARLADALVLFSRVVAEAKRPPAVSLKIAHASLQSFLYQLHPQFIKAAAEVPPLPDVSLLRTAQIPCGDQEAAFMAEEIQQERRILLGYVHDSRFNWSDVNPRTA